VQTHSRSQARPDFNLFCFLFILALLNKRFNSLMGGFDQPLKAGSPRDFIIIRKMHRSPFLQWRFGAPAPMRSLGLSQVVMRSWCFVPFFSLIFYLFCLLPGGSEHEPLEITPCLPVGAGCGRLVSLTYYVAHYPV